MNSNLGGRGGWDPSPEVRAKMSAAHKGRPSPRKGLKGPIQSDETKARRSESMKKAWAQPSEKVLIGRLKLVGQKRSEAFREKMRTIALHREAQKRNNNLLKQENQSGLR